MKKILCTMLILLSSFVLIGCGSDSGGGGELPMPSFDGVKTTAEVTDYDSAEAIVVGTVNARNTASTIAFNLFTFIEMVEGADEGGTVSGCDDIDSAILTNIVDTETELSFTVTFDDFNNYFLFSGDCYSADFESDVIFRSGSADISFTFDDGGDLIEESYKMTDLFVTGLDETELGFSNRLTVNGQYAATQDITEDTETYTDNMSVTLVDGNAAYGSNTTALNNYKTVYTWSDGADDTRTTEGTVYLPIIGKVNVSTLDEVDQEAVITGDNELAFYTVFDGTEWAVDLDGDGEYDDGGEFGNVLPFYDFIFMGP